MLITPRQLASSIDLVHMLYMSGNNCHSCTKGYDRYLSSLCSLHVMKQLPGAAPVVNCMVNLQSTFLHDYVMITLGAMGHDNSHFACGEMHLEQGGVFSRPAA